MRLRRSNPPCCCPRRESRFRTVVLAVFGVVGAVLACVGVYGVAAYSSGRRRREIGLRIALGANVNSVRALLVRQSMGPVVIGGTIGVIAAAVAASRLQHVLPQPTPLWAWAVGSAAVLAACALIATLVPAYRATQVSPLVALRHD